MFFNGMLGLVSSATHVRGFRLDSFEDIVECGFLLVVIGFPCDQFGGQEPGNSEQILSFCKVKYGVTFPLSDKIEVAK